MTALITLHFIKTEPLSESFRYINNLLLFTENTTTIMVKLNALKTARVTQLIRINFTINIKPSIIYILREKIKIEVMIMVSIEI